MERTEEAIDLKVLRRPDPILWSDASTLFEDELGDNGCAAFTVKTVWACWGLCNTWLVFPQRLIAWTLPRSCLCGMQASCTLASYGCCDACRRVYKPQAVR